MFFLLCFFISRCNVRTVNIKSKFTFCFGGVVIISQFNSVFVVISIRIWFYYLRCIIRWKCNGIKIRSSFFTFFRIRRRKCIRNIKSARPIQVARCREDVVFCCLTFSIIQIQINITCHLINYSFSTVIVQNDFCSNRKIRFPLRKFVFNRRCIRLFFRKFYCFYFVVYSNVRRIICHTKKSCESESGVI